MSGRVYNKIKKQNGEKFAKAIRNYHNGILEIPNLDVITRHAGRIAEPLIPYLISLLSTSASRLATGDPFALLKKAGYTAFHADTIPKQNSIAHYFAEGELLCTFNDSSRCDDYHIIHAVRENADTLRREDFRGREQRQDEYGTSVISIQMLKDGGFISIKNRYNHAVDNCDNTFNSNPDAIIDGLSGALQNHFEVVFSTSKVALPEGYAIVGVQIFKYHQENNNIYYGDQAWVKNGVIHRVDRSAGDALFDGFLFDNKTKTLQKIDPVDPDTFADDFNRDYGGTRGLTVQNGNLVLDGEILIGAEASQIKTIFLPALTTMGEYCFYDAPSLTTFNAPALTTMGKCCLHYAKALTACHLPSLITMGENGLQDAPAITVFEAPNLTTMEDKCFHKAPSLTSVNTPNLTTMGNGCFHTAPALTRFDAPALTTIGNSFLYSAPTLTRFDAPALTTMGEYCLNEIRALTEFNAPSLTALNNYCLYKARSLTTFNVPALTAIEDNCLYQVPSLTTLDAPSLISMAKASFQEAPNLTTFHAPVLTTMGEYCLHEAPFLTTLDAPSLITMRNFCLYKISALTVLKLPSLTTIGDHCLSVTENLTVFEASSLITTGKRCLCIAPNLTTFNAPSLTTMGEDSLSKAQALTEFNAPCLTAMGEGCLYDAPKLATPFSLQQASAPSSVQKESPLSTPYPGANRQP